MIKDSNDKKYRVAIVAPTPFYYHIPLYQRLTEAPEIELMVYYCSSETLRGAEVREMYKSKGTIVSNDKLLKGYNYKFLRNYSPIPSYMRWPFGLINPGIWKELEKEKYDIVILQSWTNLTWWLAFFACLKNEIPFFFLTDTNIWSDLIRSRLKMVVKKVLLGRFLFQKADGFFVSGKANRRFYESYGVPKEKMVKLPHWWGYERFLSKAEELRPEREGLRRSFDIKNDEFVFLYVGRFAKEKDLPTLVKAYSKVEGENKLLLVGDGPVRPRIEKQIDRLGLEGVRLMGFQPQEKLLDFYTVSDALILPSEEEPWGMVVNEAMCFGVPVIASNRVGAAMDLIREGENGFVFPAGESDDLARCMNKLAGLSSEEYSSFRDNSIERITDWINETDPVEQIIKAVKINRS